MKTQTNMPLQAALYARVSSDRQKEEGTIESQLEALRAEAKALQNNKLPNYLA